MKKNLTYRDRLLELAKIYKISEIQNYIKRKKILTTSQLEHILKKNNITIPNEINVSFYKKNISKPISKTRVNLKKSFNDFSKNFFNLLSKTWKNVGKVSLGMLNTMPKVINIYKSVLVSIFVPFFSNLYNQKVEVNKVNKIVTFVSVAILIIAVGSTGYTVLKTFDKNNSLNVKKTENIEKKVIDNKNKNIQELKKKEPEKTVLKKEKKVVKKPLLEKKDKIVAKPENNKKKLSKKETNKVTGLVLPDLNLKTETVLNLFKDVDYDLKTVRYQKRVKPIYFTQFPKDLDEIKDTKLKKDTFIKIVLPLVVAENEKILDDRFKLKKILSRKNTTDKEKLWLRQKLREYKVKKSDMKELEKRMDIIPVSVALAQAAKESGWGTSRFALEGNAIFGQWTWTGQGIEPLDKGKNENHKILRFPILRASVKAYKNNLNTHKGYSRFREKRENLRKKNRPVTGLELISSLDKYAQTGIEYVRTLEKIIKQNKLNEYETVKLTSSVSKIEYKI